MKLGVVAVDYDLEFRLLDQLLKADSRNFHGWNHRRFVAALKNVRLEDELKFTTEKINSNFSNYSAWYNRSAILSQLMKQKAPGFASKEQVLKEEFELIHQAIFTDPDDQSGWFYHLWLLDQIVDCEPTASKWHIETISNEITLFRELMSEINCKISKLTLARLLIARDIILSRGILPVGKRNHFEEALQLYDDLMELDPAHIGYYKDQCSLVILDQIASQEGSWQ